MFGSAEKNKVKARDRLGETAIEAMNVVRVSQK